VGLEIGFAQKLARLTAGLSVEQNACQNHKPGDRQCELVTMLEHGATPCREDTDRLTLNLTISFGGWPSHLSTLGHMFVIPQMFRTVLVVSLTFRAESKLHL
jgi:hypothetical protein